MPKNIPSLKPKELSEVLTFASLKCELLVSSANALPYSELNLSIVESYSASLPISRLYGFRQPEQETAFRSSIEYKFYSLLNHVHKNLFRGSVG